MKNLIVSIIIIDYKKQNPYLIECLKAISKQTHKNFEIILESDYSLKLQYPKLKIVHYGGRYQPPANKRDHASKIAKGEILAFIDDDAHPHKDWLKNMIGHFSGPNIAGVGGPGVTPPTAGFLEEASGWMSASPMGAGPYTYRFLPGKKQFVDDYPSMNLAVRRSDFLAIGGYDSHYWPGEDTKLCLDLVFKLKKKIIYDPKVLVYHHRRPLWKPHLRQNGSFGLHRGYFARILPQTSLRPVYLGPPLMVLGLFYLALSSTIVIARRYSDVAIYTSQSLVTIFSNLQTVGFYVFAIYLLAVTLNSLWIYRQSDSIAHGLISFPAVLITHIWYGLRFLQGFFFTKKLSR